MQTSLPNFWGWGRSRLGNQLIKGVAIAFGVVST